LILTLPEFNSRSEKHADSVPQDSDTRRHGHTLAGINSHAPADTPTAPADKPVLKPETKFQEYHPRRAQVNSRLDNQNKRIDTEVKDGQITRKQAAGLHTEDHQIRVEERDMAGQNNTHITTQEQKTLNQQENAVSGQIGK
jgi:hypothetical protein